MKSYTVVKIKDPKWNHVKRRDSWYMSEGFVMNQINTLFISEDLIRYRKLKVYITH